jgi:acyl-CoA synthetase (AMP-forming)/AMP-acid ligase II
MNSANFVFIWMGLWSIGAAPAFINYNLSGKPLTHSVKVSSARLLIVDEEVRERFPPEQLATFASPDFRDGKGSVEVVFFTPEVEAQILQTAPVRQDDSARSGPEGRDLAMLIYTSGTTGLPKPAIVSWAKCWAGGTFIGRWISLKKTDRIFTVRAIHLFSF